MNDAIKAKREASIPVDESFLKEMELNNRDLRNIDNEVPKPKVRYPHCGILTDGINTHGHN